MTGTPCAVATCNNTFYKAKKKGDKISFFRFPQDPIIRKKWIMACKRRDSWNPDKSYVCSDHFYDDDFERNLMAEMGFAKERKVLLPSVYPRRKLFFPIQVPKSKSPTLKTENEMVLKRKQIIENLLKDYDSANSHSDGVVEKDTNEPKPSTVLLPSHPVISPESNYKAMYFDLLAKHNELKSDSEKEIKRLRVEVQEKSVMAEREIRSILSQIFTPAQIDLLLKRKKQVKSWSSEDLHNALAIRYMSKKCYLYLKKKLNFPLPGLSTLQRWAASAEMET